MKSLKAEEILNLLKDEPWDVFNEGFIEYRHNKDSIVSQAFGQIYGVVVYALPEDRKLVELFSNDDGHWSSRLYFDSFWIEEFLAVGLFLRGVVLKGGNDHEK